MKVIPFYLPQFHEIPENNKWWGPGFTEWVNVRAAKPLYDGQYQPRVPLGENYYNLTETETLRWQADLANKYGIYGFCFYHYWFDGHMLLQRPMELLLDNNDINLRYCVSWANEDWTNAWVDQSNQTLISQTYGGEEEWDRHYTYLSQFFKDRRYIKENGRPLVVIYRPEIIPDYSSMIARWRILAQRDGFPGLQVCVQHVNYGLVRGFEREVFDYQIEYQPQYARQWLDTGRTAGLKKVKRRLDTFLESRLHTRLDFSAFRESRGPQRLSYDTLWESINSHVPSHDRCVPCAMVDWDNTPRRGERGWVAEGASPAKFRAYFEEMLQRTRSIYHKDFMFAFAWNEWAEGGYLEPDERFGYGYLEAIRDSLEAAGELPVD